MTTITGDHGVVTDGMGRGRSVLGALLRPVARRVVSTTPGRFRALATVAAAALVVLIVVSVATVQTRRSATTRLRDVTGPALIAAQELSSSLAEADAAAISTFLSGTTEDKDQRAVYERSLERVSSSLEQLARFIGGDQAAHDDLGRVLSGVVSYSGMVEAARGQRAVSSATATAMLATASKYLDNQVRPAVESLATQASDNVQHDRSRATSGLLAVMVSGAVAALVLLVIAVYLALRTRRLINIGVTLALLAIVAVVAWSSVSASRQRSDLGAALGPTRDGVERIGALRAAAYRLEGARTRAQVSGAGGVDLAALRASIAARPVTPADIVTARGSGDGGAVDLVGLLGDVVRIPAARQHAEFAEMLSRWNLYVAATSSTSTTAIQANAAFAGFNVSVDNVLASQQSRFVGQLGQAGQRLDYLLPWAALASLVGLLALGWGVERRAGEYR